MPRPKKDYRLFNVRLAEDVCAQMDRFCKETGITKTAAVENILRKYFNEYFDRDEDKRKLFG